MKRIAYYFLFICFSISAKAQNINSLKLIEFSIVKDGLPADNSNILLFSKSQVMSLWGTPQSVVLEFSEVDNKNVECLNYLNAKVWYLDDKLIALQFRSSNYALKIAPSTEIKVGN